MRPLDTHPNAWKVYLDLLRNMHPDKRAGLLFTSTGLMMGLATAGEKGRHPDADDYEVQLRMAGRRYGRDLVMKAYGWDPRSDTRPSPPKAD